MEKHERALEVDESVKQIHLTVHLGGSTGKPVKVSYCPMSESDLMKG